MHTKDRLAAALREIGLESMAVRAAEGYYDDFLSPLDTPAIRLINDLAQIPGPAAFALRRRVINGEFDGTAEESEAWAASPEGQETISKFNRSRR